MKKLSTRQFLVSLIIFSLCAIGCTPLWATDRLKEKINYDSYTLKNGLQVVIIPNHRAPVVYHSLFYKVGSADSPSNKTGIAHFLEHMMFKGSKNFPGDTFKRKISDLGGDLNANTNWDRTAFFVTLAKEYLPLVMEMEADRMQHLSILPSDVEKEREVVLQERRSTSDADPNALVSEAANSSFFWEHPYGQPVIGFEEHIRQYTAEDAAAFYKTWYVPNNAILVIAGDVKTQEIKPLIEKWYGSIPASKTPKVRQRPVEPDHRDTTAKVEIRHPKVSTAFEKNYRAPNHRTVSLQKEAELVLLSEILGDPSFGRLPKVFVENHKIAHSASANYQRSFYDPYSFSISGSPINASDLTWLEAGIDTEIRRLMDEGITEAELSKAKEQFQFDKLYRQDSLFGVADYIGEQLALDYTLKDIEQWMDVVHAITCNDIKVTANEVFGRQPGVTLYTQPAAPK